MDEKAFVEELEKRFASFEEDLLSKVKKEKTDLDSKIDTMKYKDARETVRLNSRIKEFQEEENEIRKKIEGFQEKIDFFRNGVYKKYFNKVFVTENSPNRAEDFGDIQSALNSAIDELKKYENMIRVHKFLLDSFKKKISNACRNALSGMDKMKAYLKGKTEEHEKKLESLFENNKWKQEEHEEHERELRSEAWENIEKTIDGDLAKALSAIIEE